MHSHQLSFRLLLLFVFVSFSFAYSQKPDITYPEINPHDLDSYRYDGSVFLSDSLSEPADFKFSNEGNHLFVLEKSGNIRDYFLQKAYDLTAIDEQSEYESFKFTDLGYHSKRGFSFGAQGAVLYILTDEYVHQYQLKAPYDLHTSEGVRYQLKNTSENARYMSFTSDGLSVYLGNPTSFEHYSLTTPFDFSTASFVSSKEYDEVFPFSLLYDMQISGDGWFLEGVSFSPVDHVFHYPLSEKNNPESFRNEGGVLQVPISYESRKGILKHPNGTKFFLFREKNEIRRYLYAHKMDYMSGRESLSVIDIEANDGLEGPNDSSVLYEIKGKDSGLFVIDNEGIISFIKQPDYTSPIDSDKDNIYELTVSISNGKRNIDLPIMISVKEPINLPEFLDSDFSDFSSLSDKDDYKRLKTVYKSSDVFFDSSGTIMYLTDRSSLLQYALYNPYDITNAVFEGEPNPFLKSSLFKFNPDGDKLYNIRMINDVTYLQEYHLDIPFDLKRAVLKYQLPLNNKELTMVDLVFNSEGNKLLLMGKWGRFIQQYNLKDSYDISNATYIGRYNLPRIIGTPDKMFISPDEKELLIYNQWEGNMFGNGISIFGMEKSFDITSAAYTGKTYPVYSESKITSPLILENNNDVFAISENEIIYLQAGTRIDYEENSNEPVYDANARLNADAGVDESMEYSLNGIDSEYFAITEKGVINFISSPDYENPLDSNRDNIYEIEVIGSDIDIPSSKSVKYVKVHVKNLEDGRILLSALESLGLKRSKYTGPSNKDAKRESKRITKAMVYADSGRRLFLAGPYFDYQSDSPSDISELLLEEPYNLSTASSVSTFYIDGKPIDDLAFNEDGMKLFLLYDNTVASYHLQSPFELQDMRSTENSVSFSDNSLSDKGLVFSDDGKNLYVTLKLDKTTLSFDLSVPYDLSSASENGTPLKFTDNDGDLIVSDFVFSPDGSYILATNETSSVYSFQLGIPYDPATAAFVDHVDFDSLFTTNQAMKIKDIILNSEGSKMILLSDQQFYELSWQDYIVVDEHYEGIVYDLDAKVNQDGSIDAGINYSLEGPDAKMFSIDANGRLSFVTKPDFEQPSDTNQDNIYKIKIYVTADAGVRVRELFVEISDVDDSPVFLNEIPGFEVLAAASADLVTQIPTKNVAAFNTDGTKMFCVRSPDVLEEYLLTEPYDISSAVSKSSEFSVASQIINISSLVFVKDGSILYVAANDGKIAEYELTTGFDISTAEYTGRSFRAKSGLRDIVFSSTGEKLYIAFSDEIIQYSLSDAFKISSLQNLQIEYTMKLPEYISSIYFTSYPIDNKLYVVSSYNNLLYEYDIKSSNNLSSAKLKDEYKPFELAYSSGSINKLLFDSTGTRLFYLGAQYNLPSTIRIEQKTESFVADLNAADGNGGAIDESVLYSLKGDDATVFNINAKGELKFKELPDYYDPIDTDSDNIYKIEVVASVDNENQRYLSLIVIVDPSPKTQKIFITKGGLGFDLSRIQMSETKNFIDFYIENESLKDIAFNNNGTKVYLLHSKDFYSISALELNVPYDLSVVKDKAERENLPLAGLNQPTNISFSSDGFKLFVQDESSIHTYKLEVAYDITTAIHVSEAVSETIEGLIDFQFETDGLQLVTLNQGFNINSFDLVSVFNLTRIISDKQSPLLNQQLLNPSSFALHPYGTMLFIVEKRWDFDRLFKFDLHTPFDLSTLEYQRNNPAIKIGSEDAEIINLTFNKDGTKMYTIDASSNTVLEYNMPWISHYEENSEDIVLDIDAEYKFEGTSKDDVSYFLSGADSDFFTIDSTGKIVWNNSPDFESPKDADQDNNYEFTVTISISQKPENFKAIDMVVQVVDLKDTPVFTALGQGFDLTTAVYSGVSKKPLGKAIDRPYDHIKFSNDGRKLLITSRNEKTETYTFDLETSFDITTAVYDTVFQFNQGHSPTNITFNPEGTRLFTIFPNADGVVEYKLDSAFDMSTAVYRGKNKLLYLQTGTDLIFNYSGTKLYILSYGRILTYDLAEPFKIATGVPSRDYNLRDFGADSDAVQIQFNPEGTILYATYRTKISTIYLKEPYELSGAVSGGRSIDFYIDNDIVSRFQRFTFDGSGTKLFLMGENDLVEYALVSTVSYVENSAEPVLDIDADNGQGGETDESVLYSIKGEDAGLFTIDDKGILSFINSPDFEKPLDSNQENIYDLTVRANSRTIDYGHAEHKVQVHLKNMEDKPVLTNVGYGYDLSHMRIEKDQQIISLQPFVKRPTDIFYQPDGSRLILVDEGQDKIFSYKLPEKNSISGLQGIRPDAEFSFGFELQEPQGLEFNPDGSKIYVVGTNGWVVEYALSENYNITTAKRTRKEFKIDSRLNPKGITFNPDGTRLYVAGLSEVREYLLNEPYDLKSISSNVYSFKFNQHIRITDLVFNHDGSKLFISTETAGNITEIDFSVPYELSSAVTDQTSSFKGPNLKPTGIDFDKHGTKISLVNVEESVLYSYHIATSLRISENDKEAILVDVDANDGLGGMNDISVSYTLKGDDSHWFLIDQSGIIQFNETPDFESPKDIDADNIYHITVIVANEFTETSHDFIIEVENTDDDAPVIISAREIIVAENTEGPVYKPLTNEEATFSIEENIDGNLFQFLDGQIVFKEAPDHEAPKDLGEDNCYYLYLKAADSIGNYSTTEIGFHVVDVFEAGQDDNEGPFLTSEFKIYTPEGDWLIDYNATSSEEGVIYNLGIDKDEDYFNLVNNKLNFKISPDYENPQDADGDNIYILDLILTAPDGDVNIQEIQVIVEDVQEQVTGISDNTIGFSVYPNPANTSVTLVTDLPYSELTAIWLYDLRGVIIKRFDPVKDMVYDLSDVKEGVYILSVGSGSEEATGRMRLSVKR